MIHVYSVVWIVFTILKLTFLTSMDRDKLHIIMFIESEVTFAEIIALLLHCLAALLCHDFSTVIENCLSSYIILTAVLS